MTDEPRRCSSIIEELAELCKLMAETMRLSEEHPDDRALWLSMFRRMARLLEELNTGYMGICVGGAKVIYRHANSDTIQVHGGEESEHDDDNQNVP